MNYKHLFLFLLIISFNDLSAQKKLIINKGATHFQITSQKDTIDFIVIDTTLTKKKPVLLFCQGSQPMPLFFEYKNKTLEMFGGGISNFDIMEIKKYYHLVVISMPKTPLIANIANLNNNYCYIQDSTDQYSFKKDYIKADYCENYVKRANSVIKFLRKQDWVNNNKLVVFGHSQGSKVASKLGGENKYITHVGIAGANPFGRFDQLIRTERKSVRYGEKTWEEAEKGMEKSYKFWENVNNPDSVKTHPELLAWKSFSQPTYPDLIKTKVPIYLTYGTEDITSDLCDLLPLIFISNGKTNLTVKRWYGLEHNFFEVDIKGRPIYSKGHWIEVMSEFIKWTNK